MKNYKKGRLFLIVILAIVAGSYSILMFLHPKDQNAIATAETISIPTETLLPLTATSPSQTATVEYWVSPADLSNYFSPEFPIPGFRKLERDGRARLDINAIYAINKDKVFIGGSLEFSKAGDAQRSVLLYSLDGGKHWKEVMQTTSVGEVKHIIFLDQGKGWALVNGVGELGSRTPTMLWHTADFGETWKIAGGIGVAPAFFRSYTSLKFYNSTHGEISFVCEGICQGGDHYSILSTEDGGVTWQESYHLALSRVEGDYSLYDKRLAAFIAPKGGRYGSHVGNCWYGDIQECPSYGQDGSEWQAEYSEDRMKLFVRRHLPLEDQWTTYTVPACIEYRQGKMMEVCEILEQ